MKRLTAALICILLLLSMICPVFAAGSAAMNVSGSKSSAYQGDTIDFTVTISTVENCRSAAFMLNYDSSVFEFVSGKCTLSGTTLANFSDGTGTFAFAEGTTVSGKIFTFTLRVKNSAAIGSSTISANVNTRDENGAIPTSVNTLTINIKCNHTFGAWSKVDDANHQHTCANCGTVEKTAHAWNKGTVTKEPSCKESGEKTYACSDCGATKTESMAKNENHNFGAWEKADGTNHKHACTICGKEESAAHTWNSGTVTKVPTCTEAGEKVFTCTACGHTKTESVSKTNDHSYGVWTMVDDTTHTHSCTLCGKVETVAHTWDKGKVTKQPDCKKEGTKTYICTGCGATKREVVAKSTTHTYDHNCDPNCNICGQVRNTSHKYDSAWKKDQNKHWYACSVCGEKKDSASHTPGPEATETSDQRCTVCGYVITPARNHEHNYSDAWIMDETNHWFACTGCEEPESLAQHDFENDCDPDCSVCGLVRLTNHSYGDEWDRDTENHWYACTICGEVSDQNPHTPGGEATDQTPQTCLICGYEIAPALEQSADGPIHGETEFNFSWWIIIAVIVLCGIGGAIIYTKNHR